MKEQNMNYKKNDTVDVTRHGFPAVTFASSGNLLARIDLLKQRLLSELRAETQGGERVLKGALDEAAAVAWQTPFPHLFFPELAQEKALAATQWAKRHERVEAGGFSIALAA
jgi:hypothetical protein